MNELLLNSGAVRAQAQQMVQCANTLRQIDESIANIHGNLGFKLLSSASINAALRNTREQMQRHTAGMRGMGATLDRTTAKYAANERQIVDNMLGRMQNLGGSGNDNSNFWAGGALVEIGAGGPATLKALGYDADYELYAKYDILEGEVGVGAKVSLEGYLLKGEVEGSYGLLSGSASAAVGLVGVSGEAKAVLFQDGEFNPEISLKGEAEAHGIQATAAGRFGDDQNNVHAEATGTVGYAHAEAGVYAGKDGVGVEASAGAAVVHGEATAGFTIFGINVDVTGEAEALAVGAEFKAEATTNSVELGGKFSLLAGLGLNIKVSW